ncbi:hypothetical protein C8R44DRAFT_193983 [Mycena epipterygia]|nr:hypothetical protein C8R44DRAFT_193983 [Mycena epipterygia]
MRKRESTAITKMPAVQHHFEPQTSGEDPRWEARLPPLQKDSLFPKCGECGVKLPGIPALRPHHLQAPEYCAPGIRWFAVRRMRKDAEAKIVKKVIKSQQKK